MFSLMIQLNKLQGKYKDPLHLRIPGASSVGLVLMLHAGLHDTTPHL